MTRLFPRTPIPPVKLEPLPYDTGKKLPKIKTANRRFSDTRFGRTLLGKNKLGEILHGVIDVLPIPNVHEVIKKVVKDADAQGINAKSIDVLIESVRRLDWTRTAIALVVSVFLIKGSEWTGINIEQLIEVFNKLSGLI